MTNTPASSSDYWRDGFVQFPDSRIVDESLRIAAVEAMDRVIDGEYRTGVPPMGGHSGSGPLWNIGNPHLADDVLAELAGHPGLAVAAMEAVGASELQVWGVHLYRKDGGAGATGIVGWHQDMNYWHGAWSGGVFTLWLALEEVTPDMGPMHFVPGSHTWGLLPEGDFHRHTWEHVDRDEWREVSNPLSAGGFSLHDGYTLHASGPNTSDRPRRGFVIMYRTDDAEFWGDREEGYFAYLDDPRVCPTFTR